MLFRFKGSTLQVLGTTSIRDGEWAITGGTGEFAFAQGVATHIKSKERGGAGRDWELRIRATCLTFPKPVRCYIFFHSSLFFVLLQNALWLAFNYEKF